MNLESFYLICFLVGFMLSLVAFVLQGFNFHWSEGHFHFHSDAGGHAGGAHGHGGNAHHGADMSKFNFSTLTAFVTWFGGSGYLLNKFTGLWGLLGLVLASLAGMAGAGIVFYFLAKLAGRDHTLKSADFDMIGVLGRVSSTVMPAGTGEMVFSQNGARRAASARSDDGLAIARDVEVVVTRFENGIAYVRRWEELSR